MRTILFLSLFCLSAHAEIIRLSLATNEATPGYTRHEYGEEQEAFIKDEAFISDTDIESAIPSPTRPDSVDISLTPEGTEKMIAATTPMRPGIGRIAIMVDGKVLSVPVVQSVPLGKNFVINGLNDESEPTKLAARLTGKTEKEIEQAVADAKKRSLRKLPESTHLNFKESDPEANKENENIITRLESTKITLKPGKEAPSKFDYEQMAMALHGLATSFPDSPGISSECDLITLLSVRIPDLDALVKKPGDKKIPLSKLETILKPYVDGEKSLD